MCTSMFIYPIVLFGPTMEIVGDLESRTILGDTQTISGEDQNQGETLEIDA